MKTYKKYKQEKLKNKAIRIEYNKLAFEFAIIEKIIEKRIKNGLTQKDLADAIGTKQSAISRFESGSYNPTLSFINKMSEALDFELKLN